MAASTEAAIIYFFVIIFPAYTVSQGWWPLTSSGSSTLRSAVPKWLTVNLAYSVSQTVRPSLSSGSSTLFSSTQACSSFHFTCDNGRCINDFYRCDWNDDCGDNSDERNCAYMPSVSQTVRPSPTSGSSTLFSSTQTCGSFQFPCDNGRCLSVVYRCNRYDDCGDNSDERNCVHSVSQTVRPSPTSGSSTLFSSTQTCGPIQVPCDNGRCIFNFLWCDRYDNCGDNSDERNCAYSVSQTARPSPTSGSSTLFSSTQACNYWQIPCDNGRCIYYFYRCNQYDNCGDNSDERSCVYGVSQTVRPSPSSGSSTLFSSTQACNLWWQLPCDNGNCIYYGYWCDRYDNCGDNSDERNCAYKSVSQTVRPSPSSGSSTLFSSTQACNQWQFPCDNGRCIYYLHRCNRYDNCGDNSDERNCDTDDCLPNPCVNNGTCIDKVNDYNCTCVPGFEGKNCSVDTNDCWPNPCVNSGTCTDKVNDYNCTCVPGFEGKKCSVDTDDCWPNPCVNNGTCIDKVNDYTCTCVPGFEGKNCIFDTDDCWPNPCVNSGTCTDKVNDYTCACVPGYEGKNCSVATPQGQNLYPYGPQQNDDEFSLNDAVYYDYCLKIKTDQFGLPFFGERHFKLHICRNGQIQLNYEWSWWWPRKFGIYRWFRNMAILAPFWAMTDEYVAFKSGHSKVYYHVYKQGRQNTDQTHHMLNMTSQHVKLYQKSEKFANFKATWVLVVTWEKLCPYVYYRYYYYYNNWGLPRLNCQWSNTFQAVVITDGINSFLMYNYPKGGIQWAAPVNPSYYRYWTKASGIPVAGWNAGDNGKNYLNMRGSGTLRGMYSLDDKEGNTGLLGRHFWRIENNNVQDALDKCYTWASFQDLDINILSWYNLMVREDSRMACPCTAWQAWFDSRFRWDWMSSWPKWCFRSIRSKTFTHFSPDKGLITFKMTQLCCYSTEWPGDWAALKTGPPDGSRFEVESSYDWSNSVEDTFTDIQAYKHCCVDIPMCNLFYQYRPSDNCDLYIPPIRRWFWGDPHIKTLDGGNYTFNGLGEYVMIDAQNAAFQLQARTSFAQGNSTTATIFTAGVAKEENTSIVEVRVKKGGGLDILIDHKIYSGYSNLTNRSVEIGENLSVSKPEENCLEVSFPSSTSVQFCEKKEMMSFVVTPGDDYKNKTKGLLGTWNDNPDDDFTLPDGTELSASSTLREIHFRFGVKWQVKQSQSLFTYAQNESVDTFAKPDFMPMFADNITWLNESLMREAEAQCGDDYECLFDVASTNDLSVGMVTKDISIQLVNETNALDNFPPKIVNPPNAINATLHETVQLNIKAEDNDTITFQVNNKPADATVNQSGNVLYFTWLVKSSQKFNLSFVATDDKGASTIWSPTINMCACDHDGQCVQPEEGDKMNTDSKFVYMGCACQGGYTGRFCDSDIDACEMNGQPCYAGVKCTDHPPPANASGYTCGPCPSGYTGNGAQCAELDECQSNQTNNCKQTCVNVPGSFLCDCFDGYRLNADGVSCDDINECEPTNDCMQKCTNTPGSYNCSCDQYFKPDPADWRKCVATDPCSPDAGCQHVCFKGANNQPTCACFANYELQSDGKTCKDINECDPAKPRNRCNQICENTQGSYKCSCQKGFELSRDGYVCEDINECMDEDLYDCADEFHKCVNTRGFYKCECEQGLYFIDGKCRGLEKNETAPIPSLPTPRVPSEKEKEQAVEISITAKTDFKWDFRTDKFFKEKMASVTSTYCTDHRQECALNDKWRKRRALLEDLYTYDQVHLLPGYPSNALGTLLVVFYVQQPVGLFIGNVSVLPSNTLVVVVRTYKSDLETAIGANISNVKALLKPTKSPTEKPVEPTSSSDNTKWIVIGVCVGVIVIILIITIQCTRKKQKPEIKPGAWIDDSVDPVVLENYFNTGLEPDGLCKDTNF